MISKILAFILFAQFTVPMHTGALASAGSSCSMPTSGELAEYYASATGGGAPSSCTGGAITSWGDNSGNSHNLTAVGSPTCASEAGIAGKNAVNLTGSPYFTMPSISCMTSCSVYMVLNVNSLSANSAFFSSNANNLTLAYQITTSGIQELDQQFVTAIGSSNTAFSSGTWEDVAFVYSGGTVTFYLNGVADGGGSASATITNGPDILGANYSSGTYFPANAKIAEMYWSNVGTYQSAVHACNVTRFGI